MKPLEEIARSKLKADYLQFSSAVWQMAYFHLRNSEAARDISQTVFLEYAQRLGLKGLESIANPKSFLLTAARYRALNLRKRNSKYNTLHANQFWFEAKPGEERSEELAKALGKLSVEEQELIALKTYEELSWKEIAEITGLEEGNVAVRYHRALKKIQDDLKGSRHA